MTLTIRFNDGTTFISWTRSLQLRSCSVITMCHISRMLYVRFMVMSVECLRHIILFEDAAHSDFRHGVYIL